MGWVVHAKPRPLYHPGITQYPLYRRLGKPQDRSGQVQKNSLAPEFDPWTIQPQQVAIPTEPSQPFDIHTGFLFYSTEGI